MEDALKQLLPIFGFMLIPVWIPLLAVAAAGLTRLVRQIGRLVRPTVPARPRPAHAVRATAPATGVPVAVE